jgi:folate-binding protein YgfZ
MNQPVYPIDWTPQYEALTSGAGLVDLGQRTQIEVTGADRATWLHNLTTNDIRQLAPGTGCETFFTNVQGKTLAHGFVWALPDALVIDTVPGQAEMLLAHLDHYLIAEQVTLADRSQAWAALLLAGASSERLLTEMIGQAPPRTRLAHAAAPLGGRQVYLRRAEMTGPVDFLISGPADDVEAARASLGAAGAVACDDAAFQAARIEWGFPLFGPDISVRNLPQEVARDAVAISFVKGCYLGQETVARIDALGHVNKTLVGVRFSGPQNVPPGLELSASGDLAGPPAGTVTSVTYSPRLNAPLALAYVRRGLNTPGTRLTSSTGEAEVVALPVR